MDSNDSVSIILEFSSQALCWVGRVALVNCELKYWQLKYDKIKEVQLTILLFGGLY